MSLENKFYRSEVRPTILYCLSGFRVVEQNLGFAETKM